jgi:hypothetical protein
MALRMSDSGVRHLNIPQKLLDNVMEARSGSGFLPQIGGDG